MFKSVNKNKQKFEVSDSNIKILIDDDSRFDIKEAYNELRTNITFLIPKKECKTICVTSAVASEGKSTTSVNNAITFARAGKKVLLIDCDLRKPNVYRILNIKNDKGISEVLVSEAEIKNVIHKNVFENMDVITSGVIPPNPVELLSSERMSQVISELSQNYDYIFIDAPPIAIVTDAALISNFTDGVIIVVRQNVAERKMILDAVKKLEFVGAKILGFVLNDAVSSKSGYGSYKYKYKYNNKYN